MVALFGDKVALHQENGPDVELHVWGDEFYARYETPDGYAAIYDLDHGRFVYARLQDGGFVPTGVPVDESPPPGLERKLVEAPDVRTSKEARRRSEMGVDR